MTLSDVGAFLQVVQSQIGTPYVYGGETPGAAFDCSGLVQWAASKVGVQLPRTAAAQYTATQRISTVGAPPAGALVFFRDGSGPITHVGVSLGGWYMVDAPHTGARVRVESFRNRGGYVGATDPFAGTGKSSLSAGQGYDAAPASTESASFLSDARNTLAKVTLTVLFVTLGAAITAGGLYRGVQQRKGQ